jgi:antitoxin VapB
MAGTIRPPTGKIFMHGRSQAVRLPKEFRLPGTEVRVSRFGNKVVLEPLEKAPFDVKAWLAKLESYHDLDWPEMPPEQPESADDSISFD